MSLSGKAAIVTGGAQGIGRAIAWRLATEGAAVHIADTQTAKGVAEAAAIRADGFSATFQTVDVSDSDQVQAMVDAAVEHHGRLDILVNNAAVMDVSGTSEDTSAETWDHGFAVMVRALSTASARAVPHMRRVGGGSIVSISSVHGFLASDSAAVYDTCKHAVIGLTRGMAVDFGPDGVRANAICPGMIVTEVRDKSWQRERDDAVFAEMYHPIRRVGRPRDIAAGVSFLVSDDAAFITGHSLVIDGGLTIQLQDSVAARAREYFRSDRADQSLRTPPI